MRSGDSIDLRLLVYFAKTAETGGITRAAAALNVAQPTLTKAIRLLEHQLGVALFVRGPQGVTLTPIGERLLRHARTIMTQVSGAVADVESLRTGIAGSVHIGAGPSWVRRMLPEAVARALEQRPELRITVSGGFDETLLRGLREGDLDVVVAEVPLTRRDPEYEVEVLTCDRLTVCGRADHPLAGRRDLGLEEVLAQPWALPPPHTLARRKLDGKIVSLGLPAPACITTSSSLTFILSLVARSDTLTYTTLSALRTPEGAPLAALEVPQLTTARDAGLIFRKPKLLSPATEFVVDRLRDICRADPRN